jgi:hypothetical protein
VYPSKTQAERGNNPKKTKKKKKQIKAQDFSKQKKVLLFKQTSLTTTQVNPKIAVSL